jgi:hypothetical protein
MRAEGDSQELLEPRDTRSASQYSVVVEIRRIIDAKDYAPHHAVIMKFDGGQWIDTKQTRPVRNISPYMILGSKYAPVRLVAKTVGNLGLCVEPGPMRAEAKMLEDLPAAVDTKRDPSEATARILIPGTTEDLRNSDKIVTVTNRFLNISIDAGTYVRIEPLNGKWYPYVGDCPGGSNSESL